MANLPRCGHVPMAYIQRAAFILQMAQRQRLCSMRNRTGETATVSAYFHTGAYVQTPQHRNIDPDIDKIELLMCLLYRGCRRMIGMKHCQRNR